MGLFETLPSAPLTAFSAWFEAAQAAGERQPEAMALATATAGAVPSVRYVLFKGLAGGSLVFYTNHASRKGRELAENPLAAAVFYWRGLHRQVRVEGAVRLLDAEASARYFHARPSASQISALASHQSHPIASREELEDRAQALEAEYAGQPLPTPDFWGGYRLQPARFEFWQGQSNRLHDRVAYTLEGEHWHCTRLAP